MKKIMTSFLTLTITIVAIAVQAQDIRYSSKQWSHAKPAKAPAQTSLTFSTVSSKPWLKSGPYAEAAFLPGKRVAVEVASPDTKVETSTVDTSKPWLAEFK